MDYIYLLPLALLALSLPTLCAISRGTCPADTPLMDEDISVERAREILMSDDPVYEGFHPSGVSPAPTYQELALGDRPDVTSRYSSVTYQMGRDDINLTDFNCKRVRCKRRNLTEVTEFKVQMVNSSSLLRALGEKNDTASRCVVVLFYAPWCPFCAQISPHYNAIARAFYMIDVLAIDAMHFSHLNSRFGTIAVPNILVFHNAKAVARFNHTERTFTHIRDFIGNVTGLRPNRSVDVTEEDHVGPLKNTPTVGVDYYLLLAWGFILTFTGYQFSKSSLGQRVLQAINNLGQEQAPNL